MSGLGVESLTAAQWIYQALGANSDVVAGAVGGIWDGPARDGSNYPIARFDFISGVPARGNDVVIIWQNMLWQVRGVCEGTSYDPLKQLASGIYAALHGKLNITMSDGLVYSSVQEQEIHLESIQGGREYRQLGGIYRIIVQGT